MNKQEKHETNLFKSPEEMYKLMLEGLKKEGDKPMTEEEILEDDAEGGYFDDLEWCEEDDEIGG